MPRLPALALLAASGVALAGCLPVVAANVADAAVGAAIGRPKNNEGSGSVATDACTARAAAYGTVHVIDTEQHTPSEIIVWGTATSGTTRQSFKCVYGTKVTSFRLRPLPAQS